MLLSSYLIHIQTVTLEKNLMIPLAWFSLAHKHKHKDVHTRRMAYLTELSIPALLNPMINKMANKASAILLLICSHEVWVKGTYDWSKALCLCLCLCRLRFHQLKLRRKHEHKKNELVRFSCACAYAYPLVKTRLKAPTKVLNLSDRGRQYF